MIPVRTAATENTEDEVACAVDGTCAGSACGCGPAGMPARAGAGARVVGPRRGLAAGLLAVACAAACLAVPLAIGGLAAASGAVAGEWWLVLAIVAATAVASFVVVRRRDGDRVC